MKRIINGRQRVIVRGRAGSKINQPALQHEHSPEMKFIVPWAQYENKGRVIMKNEKRIGVLPHLNA